MTKIKPFQLKVEDIKPNDKNPRTITESNFDRLVQSLKEFPEMLQYRPVVINKESTILGGNMRYKAAVEAGLKKIWVISVDLPPEKEREFIIKDNVSAGAWNWEVLANEWEPKMLKEWGMDVWQPTEDVDLEDFFDNVEGKKPPKEKLVLEYTEDDLEEVEEMFDSLEGSREKIVLNLLGISE